MTCGVIAGNGVFPLQLVQVLAENGYHTVVAAHTGETDLTISEHAHAVTWIQLGELGKVLEFFEEHHVETAFLAGGISRKDVLKRLRLDTVGMDLFSTLDFRGDDAVLRGIATLLEKRGFTVEDAASYLPEVRLAPGLSVGQPPTPQQLKDIRLGQVALRTMGPLDVAQAVVVKDGSIWAIEAAEGTDAMLARGGEIAGRGAILVKGAKPGQDSRFDAPTIGPRTVELCAKYGFAIIAFDCEKGLVLEKNAVLASSLEQNITVYGIKPSELE